MATIEDRMGRAFGLDAAEVQSAGKLWFIDRMVWLHDDMVRLGHTPPPLQDALPDVRR